MQRAMVLRVGLTIEQVENEHLQNLLVFRVWIIWEGTKFGGTLSPNATSPLWLRACCEQSLVCSFTRVQAL